MFHRIGRAGLETAGFSLSLSLFLSANTAVALRKVRPAHRAISVEHTESEKQLDIQTGEDTPPKQCRVAQLDSEYSFFLLINITAPFER